MAQGTRAQILPKLQHDIVTRNTAGTNYVAECRTHAVGTPPLPYRAFDMWIKAHMSVKCECGHVAGSHGSIPVWVWHLTTEGITTDGTACGTCQCARFR